MRNKSGPSSARHRLATGHHILPNRSSRLPLKPRVSRCSRAEGDCNVRVKHQVIKRIRIGVPASLGVLSHRGGSDLEALDL